MTLDNHFKRIEVEKQQDALLMANLYADGLTIAEIAEKFDIKKMAVLSAISEYLPSAAKISKYKREFVKRKLGR